MRDLLPLVLHGRELNVEFAQGDRKSKSPLKDLKQIYAKDLFIEKDRLLHPFNEFKLKKFSIAKCSPV